MLSDGDDTIVVLDACVLLPAALRDTLLRLAETPWMYIPKWSNQIWDEVTRNLAGKLGLNPDRIAHLTKQTDLHFPDARVDDYEKLLGLISNHPKDRHVVAAAVKSGAKLIVTYNLRDFPPSSLSPWGVTALHPDTFLVDLWKIDRDRVIARLRAQAATIRRTVPELLGALRSGAAQFADLVSRELS